MASQNQEFTLCVHSGGSWNWLGGLNQVTYFTPWFLGRCRIKIPASLPWHQALLRWPGFLPFSFPSLSPSPSALPSSFSSLPCCSLPFLFTVFLVLHLTWVFTVLAVAVPRLYLLLPSSCSGKVLASVRWSGNEQGSSWPSTFPLCPGVCYSC